MKNFLVKFFSTYFYIGFIPVAPGSMASLVVAGLCYFLQDYFLLYVGIFVITALVGYVVSGPMEKLCDKKDPGCVVIDEAAGMMISFFMLPLNWSILVVGYFLFRAFDMFKIYPANVIEQKGGGFGIMTDDLIAGLYTNIILQIALRII